MGNKGPGWSLLYKIWFGPVPACYSLFPSRQMVGKSKILYIASGPSSGGFGLFGTFLFCFATGLFLEDSVEPLFAGGALYPDLARIKESFRSRHRGLILSFERVS